MPSFSLHCKFKALSTAAHFLPAHPFGSRFLSPLSLKLIARLSVAFGSCHCDDSDGNGDVVISSCSAEISRFIYQKFSSGQIKWPECFKLQSFCFILFISCCHSTLCHGFIILFFLFACSLKFAAITKRLRAMRARAFRQRLLDLALSSSLCLSSGSAITGCQVATMPGCQVARFPWSSGRRGTAGRSPAGPAANYRQSLEQ